MKEAILFLALLAGGNVAPAQQTNSVGFFAAGQYTRPSQGFFPASSAHILQRMDSKGPSRAAEYCHSIGRDVGCLMYIRTVTESELVTAVDRFSWPMTDTDFNLKWKFPLRKRNADARFLPYATVGAGAILLNGGTTYKQNPKVKGSGFNGQGDILAGMGFDRKISRSFGIRIDLTAVALKQNGFSDTTYKSGFTDKVQVAAGFVRYWDRGIPKR